MMPGGFWSLQANQQETAQIFLRLMSFGVRRQFWERLT
jgi:hypothetical protein